MWTILDITRRDGTVAVRLSPSGATLTVAPAQLTR